MSEIERRNFGRVQEVLEIPNLTEIQTRSYEEFLQLDADPAKRANRGLEAVLREVYPITSYDGSLRLDYVSYRLGRPRYTPDQCRALRLTYGRPFRVTVRLSGSAYPAPIEEEVYVGEIPIMLGGGEFIINGAERVIVSQLHRSPGVDFSMKLEAGDRRLHSCRIIPERGSWIEINVSKKDVLQMRIDQSSKIPVTAFLRAMNLKFADTETILRLFYETKRLDLTKVKAGTAVQDLYVASPVVDKSTGEVVLNAGERIGEKWDTIRNSSIKQLEVVADPQCDPLIVNTVAEDKTTNYDEAILYIYGRLRVGNPPNLDKAKQLFTEKFYDVNRYRLGRVGRFRLQRKFGQYGEDRERKNRDAEKDLAEINNEPNKWLEKNYQGLRRKYLLQQPVDLAFIETTKEGGQELKSTELKALETRLMRNHCAPGSNRPLWNDDEGLTEKEIADVWSDDLESILKRATKVSEGDSSWIRIRELNEHRGLPPTQGIYFFRVAGSVSQGYVGKATSITERLGHHFHDKFDASRPGDCGDNLLKTYRRLEKSRIEEMIRLKQVRGAGQEDSLEDMTIRPEDFIECIRYVMKLRKGEGYLDDIDDLGNRRLRTIDELAGDEIRKGFLKLRRTVQERMSLKDPKELTPRTLINSKSVSSSIDFFFGRSELSQVVDQTNPLAQLANERRLSALGPGGLNRKRAGFEVRDVHVSHYGRICPIETPEGTNIGLIAQLGIYATVDPYGFLVAPYRKVLKGKIGGDVRFMRADEEMQHILAPADAPVGNDNRIQGETIIARVAGDFKNIETDRVEYVDVSPKQLVGVSASLIPFLEHDDANRALMGSNMQRQAVPLLNPKPPVVATGMEKPVAENSGMVVRALEAGEVTYVDGRKVVVRNRDGWETEYPLRKFVGLNERTCLNQKPIVAMGEKVKRNQVLADGPGTCQGELALGRDVLVAFMTWDGYNFEDAILINEDLLRDDRFTSIHIDEFEVEVRETKLGREEFTRDIPNVSERQLRSLDDQGMICVGTRVIPGDLLVGKVSPKSKTELSPEEKLLHAIFGRAGEDVKNDSLVVPSGTEGIVIQAEKYSRVAHLSEQERRRRSREAKKIEKEMNDQIFTAFRSMVEKLNTLLRTKIADPVTGQEYGVPTDEVVLLEQVEKFDYEKVETRSKSFEDGREIIRREWPKIQDLLDEKERQVSRLKRGDELPSGVLEMVKIWIATKRTLSVGDKMAGRHGNKGVIARILAAEDMPFLPDGRPVEILLNPLGVPSRMNVGQILETHLGWAAKVLGFQAITPVFDGCKEDTIHDLLEEAGLPRDGKVTLHDGRTGEPFDQKVTVGHIYMMKLHHLVDDKVHARATGPYSLITQQPLGGKARSGGQRFGEMEVWALESYGAAYVLQELLTVKSDDVEGRTKIYESMVMGRNTLEAGTPVSFDVLCNEIKGLCLNIQLEKKRL